MKNREELLIKIDDDKKILFGLLLSFSNVLQTVGDTFYQEITIKQFYLLICLSLFEDDAPTINQLAEVMGSSHQNVKQILNKLKASGFLNTMTDSKDKRKTRIIKTKKLEEFDKKYQSETIIFMKKFYENVTEEQIRSTIKTIIQLEKNLLTVKEKL